MRWFKTKAKGLGTIVSKAVLAACLLLGGSLSAQLVPTGSETKVNTTVSESQQQPAVAMDASGSYVVVWESFAQDGDDYGIYMQKYNADGTANGAEVKINNTTASAQRRPDIASDAAGNIMVTWMSYNEDGDGWGCYRRRIAANGTMSSVFRVNSSTSNQQMMPAVGSNANGDWVFVFMSNEQDGDQMGVYARNTNPAGANLNSPYLVNDSTKGYQGYPDVALDAAGNYVIVWQSDSLDGDGFGIYAARYDASFNKIGADFKVNTSTAGHQQEPSVAMDENGNFLVTWSGMGAGGTDFDIWGQRYDNTGAAVGAEFRINSTTADVQDNVDATMTTEGYILVTWNSYAAGGNFTEVYAQAYNVDGTPFGGETMVNTRTTDFQHFPSVAVSSIANDPVVAWQDGQVNSTSTHDGSNYGVYMQRFIFNDTISPVAVCKDTTYYLNAEGKVLYTASDLDGGSTDNIVVDTIAASVDSFTCANVGPNSVEVYVFDKNGNSDTCTSTVTILDTIAPTVVCQNLTVYLDGTGNAAIVAADVDNGSNDICGLASLAVSPSSFTCANIGANNVTLTVTDNHGNVDSCTAVVTVADTTSPIVACQDISIYLDANGTASIAAGDIDNGSSDNCAIASLAVSPSSFTCANVGANNVTLTVTDNSGNVDSCTAVVTVNDTISPNVVCKNLNVYLDPNGTATITAADVDNGSNDACGLASLAVSPSSFNCSNLGANNVTLTVTDNNGNVDSCIAVMTVLDTVSPAAICQNVTVYLDATGNASITAADVDNGSSDACGIASLSVSPSSFTCANTTPVPVTLTVTDVNGNTSTCTSNVTVTDTISPTAICQNITVQLDANGNASITPSQVNNGSSDNCGIASISVSPNTFTTANVGTNAVTLTVTDLSGNISTCSSTVTIEDNIAPNAVCQNVTVQLDANGNASITANDVDNGSSDASGISSLSVSPSSFTCANVGANTVTLTVTDNNGNSSTCTATVTVEDNLAPTAVCQNITVQLDANGQASITAQDVDNGSNDACGIASLSVSPSSFTCANAGNNTVTLTVTDNNGNTSTCTSTVTIQDNIAPSAVCQNITVQLDANGQASITAQDVNNGSSDNCGIASISVSPSSFTCANVGANTVTLTVTDANGNSSTCTSTVTVEDNIAPNAVCLNLTIPLDANGVATINEQIVDGGSSDNCGIASIAIDKSSFTCAEVGTNSVVLTVTDVNGNSSTCTSTVTVVDNIAPTVVVVPTITIPLGANGEVNVTPQDLDNGSFDNCGIASMSINRPFWDCSDVSTSNITLTVTDVNGNSASATSVVTIVDNTAPIVVCQNATVQLDANGQATITAQDIDNGSSDNCLITSLTVSPNTFTCANIGANTVTLTAVDEYNNTSTCTATVTVQDNTAPNTVCQNITAQLDANGQATITAQDVDGGSTDNCGIASLSVSPSSFTCTEVGANTVTLTVTDVNGNVSTCTSTVTVEDNVAPTVVVVPTITIPLGANGEVLVTPQDLDNGSFDNCGIASMSVNRPFWDCSDVSTSNITLTVTDVNGNSASATSVVSIVDNTAPIVVCQNATVQLDANGQATITAQDIDNGSSDNCLITSLTVSPNTFTCTNIGANTVTLTAVDEYNNTSTCTATVTVQDFVAPNAVCQNITVQLDANGQASITAQDVDGGSTDNCGIASLSVSPSTFDCTNVGANLVTLTVTDVNGNSSICSSTVTVEDNVDPTAICQNITAVLDTNGQVWITPQDVDGGSTDNCGIASLSLSNDYFNCNHVGTNTVTLTVTDVNGNSSTCTSTVTVVDDIAPILSCEDLTITLDANGQASITAQDVYGMSRGDRCGVAAISINKSNFTCADVGANTVTLTAIDINGNVATCTSTVTVQEFIAPTAVCQNITVQLDANGQATITPQDVDGGSTDNCGIATLSVSPNTFNCSNVGANTVTLTVTDVNGNSSTCTSTVTVEDNVAPTAICQNVTIQLDANGQAYAGPQDLDFGSTDNCGIDSYSLSKTTFGCGDVGTNQVTFTVTDIHGNSSTCISTVTVEDTIAPTLVCKDFTLVLGPNGNATVQQGDLIESASDNCGIMIYEVSNPYYTCADIGQNTTTVVSITDVNGNVTSCTPTITVVDGGAPTALCQDAEIYLDANGQASITPQQIDNGSNDLCGNVTLSVSPSSFTSANAGANTVTLTVTDDSGNQSTCTSTVFVYEEVQLVAADCGITGIDLLYTLSSEALTQPGAQYEIHVWNTYGLDRTIVSSDANFNLLELNSGTGTGFVTYNTTFNVEIRSYFPGENYPYGPVCQVSTQPAPCTQLEVHPYGYYHHINLETKLYADPVVGAQSYIFQVRDAVDNSVHTISTTQPVMDLTQLPEQAYHNQYYEIKVSAVLNNYPTPYCAGTYVWVGAIPVTQLSADMPDYNVIVNEDIWCDPVPGTPTTYEFWISHAYYTNLHASSDNYFTFAELPPYPYENQYYAIWARTIHPGRYGPEYSNWGNYTYVYYQSSSATPELVTEEELMDKVDFIVYPNPFSDETNIHFELESDQRVIVKVTDMYGKEVTRLMDEEAEAGTYDVQWNGQSMDNDKAARGIYMIEIITPEQTLTQRVILQ